MTEKESTPFGVVLTAFLAAPSLLPQLVLFPGNPASEAATCQWGLATLEKGLQA